MTLRTALADRLAADGWVRKEVESVDVYYPITNLPHGLDWSHNHVVVWWSNDEVQTIYVRRQKLTLDEFETFHTEAEQVAYLFGLGFWFARDRAA